MTDNEIIKALECDAISDFDHWVIDLINRQKAEIVRLEEEKEQLKADFEMFTDIGKMYSELKADAIKEFAERLKYRTCCIPQHHFTYGEVEQHIDYLVKEMVGDLK